MNINDDFSARVVAHAAGATWAPYPPPACCQTLTRAVRSGPSWFFARTAGRQWRILTMELPP